jgi:hypothetical protein
MAGLFLLLYLGRLPFIKPTYRTVLSGRKAQVPDHQQPELCGNISQKTAS